MRPLSVTRYSCPMVARRVPTFPAGMLANFMIYPALLSLPDDLRLFMCHDYTGGGDIAWETTVGEEKRTNIHLKDGQTREEFIALREARMRHWRCQS